MDVSRLTSKGRATRARIVEAAADQVRAHGLETLSLDAVGTATSTSRSQLFHYFPQGKRGLLRAVFEHEIAELTAAQEPALHDLSSRRSWEAWRDGLSDYYFTQGRWTCPLTALAAQVVATDEDLSAWLIAQSTTWRQTLATGVAAMRHRQQPNDQDEDLAATMICQIQGGLIMGRIDRSPESLRAALRRILDWIPAQAA
jgi:AcrR family transcriptional regulator